MWPRFLLKCFVVVVYTVLAFCAGIVLAWLLSPPAHARNPPHYDCKGYMYPRIQCEATFVDPFTPQWSLYLNGYRVEYENGVYVYLTVAEQWERAEVCLLDNCVTFYVRWSDKTLQFKEEE